MPKVILVFLLKSRQNTLYVMFLVREPWAALIQLFLSKNSVSGSCDLLSCSVRKLFNCWYLPRRIWVPGAVHQLPESVFVVPAAQQEMALWAFEAARREWKESSYWLSSVIQLLKTCFIMRTRNSSVIPFCNRWVWSDTRGWLLEPGD